MRCVTDNYHAYLSLLYILQEAEEFADGEFNLPGDMQFETEDLPGPLKGVRVRIHPDAWPSISPMLYEIIVREVDGQCTPSAIRCAYTNSKRNFQARPIPEEDNQPIRKSLNSLNRESLTRNSVLV